MSKSKRNNNNTLRENLESDLVYPNTKAAIHPKALRDCSRRDKEIRVLGSVAKELSGSAFKNELNRFQPSGGLFKKEVECTSSKVSIRLSSPLTGTSSPYNIKKNKCEEMISESSDDDHNNNNKTDPSASVIAVKLNWRKGVKVEQVSKYSRRTKNIEPTMTTTDFDFESKMKFQKELQATFKELFPSNNVRLLDGNECHGRITMKSAGVQEDASEESENNSNQVVPIYNDNKEHEILLVPFHSKTGFDNDILKRYNFPYNARFTIGKKTFEHSFELRLATSQSPQHFGLIFSFPNDNQVVIIRSLLTVYSIFPTSSKHASLVTYSNNEIPNQPTGGSNKFFVKNLHDTISSKLREENVMSGMVNPSTDFTSFSIGSEISHPRQPLGLNRYKCSKDQAAINHKEKIHIVRTIKAETREN